MDLALRELDFSELELVAGGEIKRRSGGNRKGGDLRCRRSGRSIGRRRGRR